MAHLVALDDVWQMLNECLPGYLPKQSDEYWTIKHGGRSYRRLPLGPHGRRKNPEIQAGHIRSLVRFFEIKIECVQRHLDLT